MSKDTNIVELIKERVDTVETIGRVVSLRRSGKSWSGLCPFHKETDGSFHVYEDSGNYICFGCGSKGDIITFYENLYNISFLDACEKLAKENGIDWQPGGSFSAEKGKDELYEANRFAGSLYYDEIKKEGNPALTYLLERGLDRKTISKFRIGYADESGRMLAMRIDGNEKMQKAAEEVGLIYKYSGRYRDRFEGRVMFPIVNTRGKVIGFGGRDIVGKAKAKYINSAASDVYAKGYNLYGLNVTQGEIRNQGFAILVEGYMDLVMLYMYGVKNVCAQLGTAFTPQQAKLLSKYTKNVVLALDSDDSGQKAALAGMDILAAAGLKVRVLMLNGAKDPDDFIRTFGKDKFDEFIRMAKPMNDYKLDLMKKDYELSASDGLADYLKEAAKIISSLSPVERDYYIKKLSHESGISESAIAMQTEGNRGMEIDKRTDKESLGGKAAAQSNDLLCGILGLALSSGYAFEKAAGYRHLFSGSDYSGLMDAMLALKGSIGAAPTAHELADVLGEADQVVLDAVLRKASKNPCKDDNMQIDEYLAKLEIVMLRATESELKEAAGTDELLLKELMEIQNRIMLLESDIRSGKRGE